MHKISKLEKICTKKICMNSQSLFSGGKNKKNINSLSSAEFDQRVVMDKEMCPIERNYRQNAQINLCIQGIQ